MTDKSKQNVLFVDDVPEDASLYADYFDQDSTIQPITALSADEGLTRLAQSEIDCVVSDSVHTEEGDPLVAVAKQRYPDIPVLLHSGRSADMLPTEIVDKFLQKGTRTDDSTALEILSDSIRELVAEEHQPTAPRQNDSDQRWHSLGTFDWSRQDSLVVTVLEALAAETGSDIEDLGPLYDSIDPDALTVLMTHAATKGTNSTAEVQFEMSGYTVRVRSDGTVEYSEDTDR